MTRPGICSLSSKTATDRFDQTCRTNDIFLLALFQRCAKVDGNGAPHISRSAEVEVISPTCRAVRAALAPNGRVMMNMLADHDFDPVPDRIAKRLAGGVLHARIFDDPAVTPAFTAVRDVSLEQYSRLAFAAACPEADLIRCLPGALLPLGP